MPLGTVSSTQTAMSCAVAGRGGPSGPKGFRGSCTWARTAAPASAAAPRTPTAERRQLTVLSCTLADAARLASQLDPEDLHVVVQSLHAHCTEVIQRFAGHIAQYRRDGLLVYRTCVRP